MTTAEKKFNEIGAALAESDGTAISAMFGMPALKIGGKAFAGYWQDSMVFKLTGEPHTRALTQPDAKLFEPMKGRPMKEWVELPIASAKQWPIFAREALDYVVMSRK
jgi:hypothetical protein